MTLSRRQRSLCYKRSKKVLLRAEEEANLRRKSSYQVPLSRSSNSSNLALMGHSPSERVPQRKKRRKAFSTPPLLVPKNQNLRLVRDVQKPLRKAIKLRQNKTKMSLSTISKMRLAMHKGSAIQASIRQWLISAFLERQSCGQ